mmetsp:Transcript_8471/g.23569  ORF Transcript_8471/g.23569 Transcript_8471/m.23569 type:complete len:123 (-) Transcript_8471:4-372(-)
MIRVIVQSVGGEVYESNFNGQTTIAQVKTCVAQDWEIPVVCQNLLHGTTMLRDGAELIELVEGWHGVMKLSLTMVLSLERPMRELRVGGAGRAVEALRALGSLRAKGGEGAIVAVCMHVHDG